MADAIVQTGIGIDRETMARCDRLRACYGRSRSYVIEQALTGRGLDGLEYQMRVEIGLFNALAQDNGFRTWQEYAARYVEKFGAKTYPPTVQDLAAMNFGGKPHATAGSPARVKQTPAMAEALNDAINDTSAPAAIRPMSLRDML